MSDRATSSRRDAAHAPHDDRPARRGHGVLVDFWTRACIDWLRTASRVRAWAERYREQGLVGVDTPEFAGRGRAGHEHLERDLATGAQFTCAVDRAQAGDPVPAVATALRCGLDGATSVRAGRT